MFVFCKWQTKARTVLQPLKVKEGDVDDKKDPLSSPQKVCVEANPRENKVDGE